jgi:hypothetical protein
MCQINTGTGAPHWTVRALVISPKNNPSQPFKPQSENMTSVIPRHANGPKIETSPFYIERWRRRIPMNGRKIATKESHGWLNQLSFVLGPWHPAFVQFPVVMSILAAFGYWAGGTYEWDWALKGAGALWILAAVSSVLSLATGHFFAHRLGLYRRWTFLPPSSTGPLHFHSILAMIGLGFSCLTLPGAIRLLESQPIHGYTQFFWGIGAAVFYAWGAHEGGEMSFGMEMVPLNAPRTTQAGAAPMKKKAHAFGKRTK